ncbi:drug resistance transporter, EmrB/QacA subfamily [Pseudarthrobacter chlorophenolicus A6]|uniref:Drug resistance transporter, EmrB/QacA subfamily n=1 Tax=Pseudarthrobacter chlorophenolicus (strain ATCC 700700 / DSM 12829 / CIP 107037 / JCM 12360 / KCTC 9906 / NCIMB 13794 / A6) TaxID=452863 RepID=B8H9U2_PSECP|nr:DHA2 family efflux MFS transporter permease subunit [Pseudarthrobacter chlorophenolicus]ACL38326.1 drug resistance transporter, EmrB/QacA subfamily [Pseudarthrobacter chlorophenolicus A6]SDQ50945.1 MFS transporter, DHA2 family, lincomycin resistance protein [Pseudarthrobacter chlorophenolicus]
MSTEVSPNANGQPAQAAGTKPAVPEKMSRESVTIISTLLVATFVVILNETIMNVALQRLMVDLQVDAPTVQWLSTGFMLTMAVVIPTTGFILQSLSTRAVFMLAMGLFAGGTALAAVAPGFEILLLARIVQAGGTAIMLPLLMTTILTLVPLAKRGAVMGNVSIAISVAPAMGPTVSGLILEHFTWRFMFVFVLPVALAALAIGAKYLTNIGETEKTKLDFLSVFLTVPAFGGLVYGLSQIGGGHGGQAGPSAGAVAALVIGVAALAVFVLRQVRLQKAEAPLLDLRAFNFRMFTVSVLLMVVAMMALFGGVILLPLYLQEVRGLGSLETGLALLPGGLAMGLLGPVIGRLFDKVGPLPLTVTGSILMVVTLWQFSMLDAGTAVAWIVTLHVGLSFGLALLFTPAFTTGLNPLPPHLYSHGSAIMSTTQQVAGAAGTALLVSIFSVVSATSGLVAGMSAAFMTATVIAFAAVVLSAMMRKTEGSGHGPAH